MNSSRHATTVPEGYLNNHCGHSECQFNYTTFGTGKKNYRLAIETWKSNDCFGIEHEIEVSILLVHIFVFLQYPIICQFPTEINDTDTGCNQYHDYIFAVFNDIQEIINIIE